MARITFREAIRRAIGEEMRNDARVFVMGEDIEMVMWGGEATREFGKDRIRSTPISETGFVGAGIGAALTGMRPIVDMGVSTFLYSAMDQVVNQAAKSRYMFGGQTSVPLVLLAPVTYGNSAAAHHSDRPWGLFAQAPGLKIIVPSTPYDAKGLLKSAVRDGNPVIFFSELALGSKEGEVPDSDYTIPIGVADVKRSGTDITIVAISGAVHLSLDASEQLEKQGISVEVVDIRSVVPLDRRTIIDSVAKTGRAVVVDPAPGMCGVAAEVAATIVEHAFESLRSPVIRLTAPDIPVPFSPSLEKLMFPTVENIVATVRRLCADRRTRISA